MYTSFFSVLFYSAQHGNLNENKYNRYITINSVSSTVIIMIQKVWSQNWNLFYTHESLEVKNLKFFINEIDNNPKQFIMHMFFFNLLLEPVLKGF